MAKVGGARRGAGRPKGSLSRRHVETVAEAVAAGKTPVEYMLDIMRDNKADQKRRDWAAEKLAPYLHPRPAPLAPQIHIDLPDTSTAEGVTRALASVAQSVASGQIAPSEGQSLIAIIEAQRKSLDMRELLERLERLEQATPGLKPNGHYRQHASRTRRDRAATAPSVAQCIPSACCRR